MKKETTAKFYSKYKLYIFPLCIILSSLFLIIFVIIPLTLKLISNQKAIEETINKSNFLETKVLALESYNEDDLSKKVGFALNTFPDNKDYGNILGLLQQITAESGFSITSVAFSDNGSKLGGASSYGVKFQVKGARSLFQTLLNNLENSKRLVRVISFDVSSNQSTQSMDVSLAMDVLYSKLPQNFGTVDAPLPQISQKDEELLTTLARLQTSNTSTGTFSGQQSPRGKANPFE